VKPTGPLKPEIWMTRPETVAVIHALMAGGMPARFVGGCVRDTILGRNVKDIDIATAEPPDRVITLLEQAGFKAIPTGIDHGTITAVMRGEIYEITTLRLDVETFGRHAHVAFTDDWAADAERRDFTMNAIFCDLDGTLYDPTGGLSDLTAGCIRFVGNAHQRIQEDVLRLLRYFRFYAYYGTAPADQDALRACKNMAGEIPSLSVERVWSEFKKLLVAPASASVLDLMADWDVLGHVLPEAGSREPLARLVDVEAEMAKETDPIRRLAILLDIDGVESHAVADRLRLSKSEAQHLHALVSAPVQPSPDMTETQNRIVLYRLGEEHFIDLALMGWATNSPTEKAPWESLVDLPNRQPIPDFPVRGEDVLELGTNPGKAVGELLSSLESWWVDNNFEPDRVACLKQLELLARYTGN